MLILPRSVFYHVPKTGGQWVIVATYAAGLIGTNIVDQGHQFPHQLSQYDARGGGQGVVRVCAQPARVVS